MSEVSMLRVVLLAAVAVLVGTVAAQPVIQGHGAELKADTLAWIPEVSPVAGEAWAVELWFNVKYLSSGLLGRTYRDGADVRGWGAYTDSDMGLHVFFGTAGAPSSTCDVRFFATNEWNHLAVWYDDIADEAGAALNGRAFCQLAAPVLPPGLASWHGRIQLGHMPPMQPTQGFIDHLRVWRHALSAEDVSASFRAALSHATNATLVVYQFEHAVNVTMPSDPAAPSALALQANGTDAITQVQRTCDSTVEPLVSAQGVLSAAEACVPLPALPDLVVDGAELAATLSPVEVNIAPDDCTIDEGCIRESGTRVVLRFTTGTANIGAADMRLGVPAEQDGIFEYDTCHGHFHFYDFIEYTLLDAQGAETPAGFKQTFCISDTEPWLGYTGPGQSGGSRYRCSNQGLKRGWVDWYYLTLPCQWIDVTGFPQGSYTLRLSVNAQHVIHELDYSNNVIDVPITIDFDTTGGPYVPPTDGDDDDGGDGGSDSGGGSDSPSVPFLSTTTGLVTLGVVCIVGAGLLGGGLATLAVHYCVSVEPVSDKDVPSPSPSAQTPAADSGAGAGAASAAGAAAPASLSLDGAAGVSPSVVALVDSVVQQALASAGQAGEDGHRA